MGRSLELEGGGRGEGDGGERGGIEDTPRKAMSRLWKGGVT